MLGICKVMCTNDFLARYQFFQHDMAEEEALKLNWSEARCEYQLYTQALIQVAILIQVSISILLIELMIKLMYYAGGDKQNRVKFS